MNLSRQEMIAFLSEISPCFLENIEDLPGSYSFGYAFSEGVDEDGADHELIEGPYSLTEEDIKFVISQPEDSDWDDYEESPEVPWDVAVEFIKMKMTSKESFYVLNNSGFGNNFEIYDSLESASDELLSRTLENTSHANLITWEEMDDEELTEYYILIKNKTNQNS